MIILTDKHKNRNKEYMLRHLIYDIYSDMRYIRIKEDKIVLKRKLYSRKKEVISIKSFCIDVVPSVITHIIEKESRYNIDVNPLIKDIIAYRNQSEINEYELVSSIYHTYNILLGILNFNELSTYRPEIKRPSAYSIVRIKRDITPDHVKQKESEIDSLIKIMKKSLQRKPVLYCQI